MPSKSVEDQDVVYELQSEDLEVNEDKNNK